MKKAILLSAVMSCCLASAALADFRVGPFASWVALEDEDAMGGGLLCELMLTDNLGIDARASYLEVEDYYLVPLELGLVGLLPIGGVSLEAGAGAGYYIPEDVSETIYTPREVELEGPDPEVGFYVVAGVRVPLGDNVQLFAEGKYTKVDGDSETKRETWATGWSEVTKPGLQIDDYGANAGLLWSF